MLEPEDFMVIQALVKRGVYLCDIAGQLGVHPRTVRRALQRGGAPARRGGRRGSRLDPHRPVVDQLLAEGVWNAVVIWRELQAKGYAGGICRRSAESAGFWTSDGRGVLQPVAPAG
jgi:Helix-turn-helix domain